MDIKTIREDTPTTSSLIHFNNAGAALMPLLVQGALKSYLGSESTYGGYETADRFQSELDAFYSVAAKLLGAEKDEIAFAHSATDAWTRVFFSLPWQPGDVILTGNSEYASNYIAFLQAHKRFGVEVQVIEDAPEGGISVSALERAMRSEVQLIALTHMPTNGGLVNPAEAVGALAKAYGVLYLLDACQSVGQYPLEVSKLGCDMLTGTGRKYLRGPRGSGFLYVSRAVYQKHEPFLLDLFSAEWTGKDSYKRRPDARAFEMFERNFAGQYGLMKAMQYALDLGLPNIWTRVQSLAQELREGLGELDGVQVMDVGPNLSGIVSVKVDHKSIMPLMQALRDQRINTSRIFSSGTLLDMKNRNLDELLRVSVHYYNTSEEISRFLDILKSLLQPS